MNNLFCIKNKVVIITGGSGILGSCMAQHLAAEGAKVVILDRNEETGNALVKEIRTKGNEAIFLITDILDKSVLEENKKQSLKIW